MAPGRRHCLVLGGALALACAAPATAPGKVAERWTLRVDGGPRAVITLRHGRLDLAVARRGRTVLATPLARAAAVTRVERSRRRERYTTPAGKRRVHVLDARVLRLRLGRGRVDVLASGDGIAVRPHGLQDRTAWRAAPHARAWLQRYTTGYEEPYRERRMRDAAGRYGFPGLLRSGGTWALLTESGLDRGAPGAHLRGRDGALAVVSRRDPGWRIAVVGPLATIAASDLALSLGRPSAIGSARWVRPGRVAWSWWADSDSPPRLADQRRYTDFAAEQGWEYNLVDEGWDPAWMPDLVSYGAGRGVRQLVWSDWRALADPEDRAAALDRWASWGVAGVKVDFLLSDSGARLATMEDIARDAARRRLVVDFHGTGIPRGLERTYPNVLTVEAVRGAEHAKGGHPLDPAQEVNAALIRNAVGSMDFTPVTFSAVRRTSAGHELAEAVVFESGLQHFADTPESYRAWPAAAAFLRAVPAAWDESVLVRGVPGRVATVARRSGTTWFAGSLGAGPAMTRRLPLAFLDAGVRYTATLTADDGAHALAVRRREVTREDILTVPVERDGGFAAVLSRAGPGR